ncbi:Mitochondrial import inner membrane translocase subunit Tim8 A [Holothuria leucospilota]|uniref:Mitochondrial import inner membrane translocase subunit n=1 Tax=Holothuria leucospilota TaxID=206669 RepID=A0A9Q1BKM7_HOLLE|nr:Mitochondrial import inner membrane translocase subunit Tim8 A [Holothuria leucospilota]KAJ8028220.1 Mitochondrial import inner membrane translocase subunit Tim8 A [Holothuria leucospilota]
MSLGNEGGQIDPELSHFIQVESQKQKFTQLVHELADTCWEKCMADVRIGTRLDSKNETCLVNCVDRFIDTTNFIVRKLESGNRSRTSKLSMD